MGHEAGDTYASNGCYGWALKILQCLSHSIRLSLAPWPNSKCLRWLMLRRQWQTMPPMHLGTVSAAQNLPLARVPKGASPITCKMFSCVSIIEAISVQKGQIIHQKNKKWQDWQITEQHPIPHHSNPFTHPLPPSSPYIMFLARLNRCNSRYIVQSFGQSLND